MAPDRLGQDSRYWLDSSASSAMVGWEPEIAGRKDYENG